MSSLWKTGRFRFARGRYECWGFISPLSLKSQKHQLFVRFCVMATQNSGLIDDLSVLADGGSDRNHHATEYVTTPRASAYTGTGTASLSVVTGPGAVEGSM
ncbi:hypothetical protein Kisp02_01820 [Kineosporia sp. NBRC 101731]|nr:hypothetical protein Kisp02_01820 [Kineosporia sp. NBRC 101731]